MACSLAGLNVVCRDDCVDSKSYIRMLYLSFVFVLLIFSNVCLDFKQTFAYFAHKWKLTQAGRDVPFSVGRFHVNAPISSVDTISRLERFAPLAVKMCILDRPCI